MNAERTQQQLESILEQQIECSTGLLQCLEAERGALTGRDSEALERIAVDKTRHTRVLEELETQRERLVSELGCGSGPRGMQRCLERLGAQSRPAVLWERLTTNIRACREGNIANGGILELGRQHVEQALAILRGSTGGPPVYDAHGAASSNLGQRELGKV